MGEGRPPRLAEALLSRALRPGIRREDIVWALSEEFIERAARDGRQRAAWWYRWQAAGLVFREIGSRTVDVVRGTGGFEMSSIVRDLRFAWRAIRHSPAPFVVALITIGLGVGVNAAMFSVVNGVVLSPLPYPEQDRLVRVWPEKRWSVEMLTEVRERVTAFETIGAHLGGSLTLLGEGDPQVLGALRVTGGFFETLGTRPILGRLIDQPDETAGQGPVAVLSHGLWQSQFGGDPDVIGRTLELGGYGVERRTIVGVLEASFDYPEEPDVWIPWISDPDLPGYQGVYGGTAIARLRPGVSQEQAIAEMRRLIPAMRNEHATQFREIRYSPVDVVPLRDSIVEGVRTQLLVLLGAVAFVLLIACTNVANLLLARATRRRHEIGLRMALGADRARVLRQMVTESLLLGVVGGAVGLAMASAAMPALQVRLTEHLPRAELVTLDPTVILYALAISLVAGLLFGVVPGLRASAGDPGAVLADHGRASTAGRRSARVNEALIVAEVALSLVLVVGAGLMLKSLWILSDVDLGFDPDGVLALNVVVPTGPYDEPDARRALYHDMIARAEAVPGIGPGNVAVVNSLPLGGGWSGIPYRVEGQDLPAGESIVAAIRIVNPAYFDVLRIARVEGRLLTPQDTRDAESVAVVNEAFVRRHWPGESPLDRMILDTEGDEIGRIVGVVADTRFTGLEEPPVPTMYLAADQNGLGSSHFLIRTELADPLTLFDAVSDALHQAEPALPVRRPRLLSQVATEATGDRRFYAELFGAFAGLALLLGLVGIYGVMSYVVSQRTQEVGIRVALGATRSSVLADTVRRGMTPVLLGIGVGLVGAWAVSRSMAALLYEVQATDPAVFAVVAVLVALTGVAATLVPGWRAMRLDPVSALRQEG